MKIECPTCRNESVIALTRYRKHETVIYEYGCEDCGEQWSVTVELKPDPKAMALKNNQRVEGFRVLNSKGTRFGIISPEDSPTGIIAVKDHFFMSQDGDLFGIDSYDRLFHLNNDDFIVVKG